MAIDYAPEIETKAATNTRENTGIENKTTPEDAFVKQIQRQLAEVNKIILRAQEMGTNFKLTPHDLVQINDAIRRLKKAIDSGKFGDIQRLEAEEQRLIKLQDTARTNLIENGHVKEVELIEAVSSGDLNAESIEQQIELSGVNAFVVGMLGGDAVKELGLNPTDHQLEEYLTKIDRTRAIEIASTLESVIDEILLHGALDLREADKLETSVLAKMASKIRNITGTERSKPEKRSIEDRIEILSIMLGPAARSQDIIDKIRRETDLEEKIHKINLYFSILGHNFIDNLKQGGVAWMGLYFKTQREVTDLFGKVGEQARTALLGKLPENLRDFLKSNKAQELTNDIRDQIRNLSPQDALAKIAKIVNDRLGVKDLAGAPDSAYKLSSLFNGESADIQLICTVLQYDILTQIAASEKFKDFRFSAHNLIVGNSGHVVLYTREGNNYYKIDTLNNPSGDSLFEKIDEADVPAEVLSNLADEITHEESISNSFNKLNSDMMVNFATFAKTPEEKVQLLNTALQTDSDNLLALLYLRTLALESGNKTYADIYTNKAKRVFDKQYPNQEDKFNNLVNLAGEDELRYEAWSGKAAILAGIPPANVPPELNDILDTIDAQLRGGTNLNVLNPNLLRLAEERLNQIKNSNPGIASNIEAALNQVGQAIWQKTVNPINTSPPERHLQATFSLSEEEKVFIAGASTEELDAFVRNEIRVFIVSASTAYSLGSLHEEYMGRTGEARKILQSVGREADADRLIKLTNAVNSLMVVNSKLGTASQDQERKQLAEQLNGVRLQNLADILKLNSGMVSTLKQKILSEARRMAAEGNGYISILAQNSIEDNVLQREFLRMLDTFKAIISADSNFDATHNLNPNASYNELNTYMKDKRQDLINFYTTNPLALANLTPYLEELKAWEENWDKNHEDPDPSVTIANWARLSAQKKNERIEYINSLVKTDFRLAFAVAHDTLELDEIFTLRNIGNPNSGGAAAGQGKVADIYGEIPQNRGTQQQINGWQGPDLVRYDLAHGHFSYWKEHKNHTTGETEYHFEGPEEFYGGQELITRQAAVHRLMKIGYTTVEAYKLVYGGIPWKEFDKLFKEHGTRGRSEKEIDKKTGEASVEFMNVSMRYDQRVSLWNSIHAGEGSGSHLPGRPMQVADEVLVENHNRWRKFMDFYGIDRMLNTKSNSFFSQQYMRTDFLQKALDDVNDYIRQRSGDPDRVPLGLAAFIYNLGGTNPRFQGHEAHGQTHDEWVRKMRRLAWDGDITGMQHLGVKGERGNITEINPMLAMSLYATYNADHYHFREFWGDGGPVADFLDNLAKDLPPLPNGQPNPDALWKKYGLKAHLDLSGNLVDENGNPLDDVNKAQWRYQVFSSIFTPLIDGWRQQAMNANYEQRNFSHLKTSEVTELNSLFHGIDPEIVNHFQNMVSGMTDILKGNIAPQNPNQNDFNHIQMSVGQSFTDDPYMYLAVHSILLDSSDIPPDVYPLIQKDLGEGNVLGRGLDDANYYSQDANMVSQLIEEIMEGKDVGETLLKLLHSEGGNRLGMEGGSEFMAERFVAMGLMLRNRFLERVGLGKNPGNNTEGRDVFFEQLAAKSFEELVSIYLSAIKPHLTKQQQAFVEAFLAISQKDKRKRQAWQGIILTILTYFFNIGMVGLEQVGVNK